MDGVNMNGTQGSPAAYDYRMYDRIWQRVSPELNPYPQVRGALPASEQDMPLAVMEGSELPGARPDPCCMGSAAREAEGVLAGFIEEELAQRCCYLALAKKVNHPGVSQLLRRLAAEKGAAAGRLKSAWYLITGRCYTPAITVDTRQWNCLAELLRSVYHQEACGGFNYARAGEETTDICLAKLLGELSREAYCRAEAVMELLGRLLNKIT